MLVELIAAEAERESAASWAKVVASLANDTERLVFRGKLDGLTEQEIAEAVEARVRGPDDEVHRPGGLEGHPGPTPAHSSPSCSAGPRRTGEGRSADAPAAISTPGRAELDP